MVNVFDEDSANEAVAAAAQAKDAVDAAAAAAVPFLVVAGAAAPAPAPAAPAAAAPALPLPLAPVPAAAPAPPHASLSGSSSVKSAPIRALAPASGAAAPSPPPVSSKGSSLGGGSAALAAAPPARGTRSPAAAPPSAPSVPSAVAAAAAPANAASTPVLAPAPAPAPAAAPPISRAAWGPPDAAGGLGAPSLGELEQLAQKEANAATKSFEEAKQKEEPFKIASTNMVEAYQRKEKNLSPFSLDLFSSRNDLYLKVESARQIIKTAKEEIENIQKIAISKGFDQVNLNNSKTQADMAFNNLTELESHHTKALTSAAAASASILSRGRAGLSSGGGSTPAVPMRLASPLGKSPPVFPSFKNPMVKRAPSPLATKFATNPLHPKFSPSKPRRQSGGRRTHKAKAKAKVSKKKTRKAKSRK